MTVTTTAALLWFLGFAALAAMAVAATVRARSRGQHLESRAGLLAAAALVAATGAIGAWAWSAGPAAEGAERRAREGIAVELAIEQLSVPFAPGDRVLALGFASAGSADAPSRSGNEARHLLPGSGPSELVRVRRLEASDPAQGVSWRVEAAPGVALRAVPPSPGLPSLAQRLALASACSATRAGSAPSPPDSLALPVTASPAFRIAAVLCDRDSEWRAVLLGGVAPRDDAPARLTFVPLAGPRWRSPRLTAAAGSLLHLDGGEAQLPGLRSWNLGGDRAGWVLAIPEDPGSCARWRDSGDAVPFAGGCRLQHGGLVVRATPLVPDVDGVRTRALIAGAQIGGPALLLLVGLALARGSRRRTALVAPALGLGMLATGLAALVSWRLLWAHRIDLLRDVTVAGWRVADNQLAALLVGATLAGLAAALLAEHRQLGRRVDQAGPPVARAAALAWPLVAWALWLAVAGLALEAGMAATSAGSSAGSGAAALLRLSSLPLLLASALTALAPELLRRVRALPLRHRLTAAHVLAALALLALAGKLLAPRMVLLKLGLAYAIVVAGHAALAAAVRAETAPARRLVSVVTTAFAAVAMLVFDGGVALAITGVGLLGAMIMAGHDAMYSDAAAPRLGLLEREHARILAAYGAAAAALAAALVGWGLVASDRLLIEHTAELVLHIPLAVAALFALGAWLARRHRQPWTPWLAAALAALALWGWRQPAIERVMAGRGVSAHRVSAVVDPGYALLRDERRFMAQTSAWQAATLPAEPSELSGSAGPGSGAPAVREPDEAALPTAAARWHGQGLTGSRVADPGVARSIDNDYLPILVARELGVAGLVRTTLLLLALLLAAGALAGARLPHASSAARARKLVLTVVGVLGLYQPLAALGILPLTGISWPGLGIDSPADLWIACFGLIWCALAGESVRAASAAEPASVDERVRTTPRLRRARTALALALAGTGLAGVAMVARAGDSALGRTALRRGTTGSGDPRLDRAIAYARTLACTASPGAGLPDLAGAPGDETTARFHRELLASWHGQRDLLAQRLAAQRTVSSKVDASASSSARSTDASKAVALSASPLLTACQGRLQRWRFERVGDDLCRATFDAGWPQIRLELRPTAAAFTASCHVDVPGDPIAQLMPSPAPAGQRIRLVSRAMGDAATDLGELLVGGAVIRLRPGAPALSLDELTAALREADRGPSSPDDDAAPGRVLRFASRIQLGPTATLELDGTTVRLRGRAQTWISTAASSTAPAAWLRTELPPPTAQPSPRPATSPGAAPPAAPLPPALERITLLVADGAAPRAALFRPRRSWPAAALAAPAAATAPSTLTVDPLLADDVLAVSDRPRRAYPFGAALPMLGWVNPYAVDRSLGLDGWVHAALSPAPSRAAASPGTTIASSDSAACGTLAPPAIPRDAVCSPSPLDGVLECRVALQPELSLALAEKTAALLRDPRPVAGKSSPPLRAAVVVLRGDTGEILAHADTTWGRGPSAYAPRTPAAELALVRLREDRDPRTGEPGPPGESEAERVDWNQPIAVGSTLKPVVARAAELAFPDLAPQLVLAFSSAVPQCKGRRGAGFAAIFGHCPPTSLAGEPTTADLHDFLAHSPNWYQAAIGLLGLGLPDGGFATGDQSRSLLELLTSDLSGWPTDDPLMIRDADGPILGKRGVVLAGLRRTPLWQNVERILGRPLCTLGDRKSCVAAASRRDLCAARALPLATPGADLRHLVALGPDRFDFYGDNRPNQTTVPTREYLQWLRGSGVHPVGSLAQLTDAFGRVIYEPDPGTSGSAAQLAASWFPAPVVGALPSWQCRAAAGHASQVRGADGGLCAVLAQGGTAHRAVGLLFDDPRLTLYGAKTGTIDSLATVARNRPSCEAWNRRHTVAGRPLALASQPGWLECGKAPPDDSLFVIAFSIATPSGPVPITLGISLQRAGKGAAARLSPLLIAAVADYFDPAK
jgi:hypothetical protein